MGGSSALSCDDSSCIYLNPAGLGDLPQNELSLALSAGRVSGEDFLTTESIEQSEQRGYGVIAVPFGVSENSRPEYGTLALGYSRYIGNTDDSINTTPDGHRRSIAYGWSPLETLSIGYAFHFYDDQLHSDVADLHSHSRLLHVFGAQARLREDVWFGAEFRLGIGQSDTEDFKLGSNGLSHLREQTVVLNLTRQFEEVMAAIAVDYSHLKSRGNLSERSPGVIVGGEEEGYVFNMRVGAEVEPLQHLLARAGFRWYQVVEYEFEQEGLEELTGSVTAPYWSVGLGYLLKLDNETSPTTLGLDYGLEYTPLGPGDWRHLANFALRF